MSTYPEWAYDQLMSLLGGRVMLEPYGDTNGVSQIATTAWVNNTITEALSGSSNGIVDGGTY